MELRLADPERRYAAVRLCSALPLLERDYRRADGAWVLTLPPLPVARLEYELDTVRATYPRHEQEQFAAHFRGLVGQGLKERGATAALA